MIRKVYRSETDLDNLSIRKTKPLEKGVNLDYRKKVVNKPWGYEYLLFENEFVAIWILFLKDQGATSMHCHPKKDTSLTVLSGSVESSTLDNRFKLQKGQGLFMEKGVFHSTKGISPEGAFIMEIETPPDKNDLVRLKDNYGREDKSYEGSRFITEKIDDYEYCDFHDCLLETKVHHETTLRDVAFTLCKGTVDDMLEKSIGKENVLFSVLDVCESATKMPLAGEIFYRSVLEDIQGDHHDEHVFLIIN